MTGQDDYEIDKLFEQVEILKKDSTKTNLEKIKIIQKEIENSSFFKRIDRKVKKQYTIMSDFFNNL